MGHYKSVRACREDYRISGHRMYYDNMPGLPTRPRSVFRAFTSLYQNTERCFCGTAPEYTAINALRALRPFRNINFSDLHRLLPPDEFADELNVMADVRGYFQVAYKACLP